MSSLNEFISSVKTEGLMQSNRFSVEFNLPTSLDMSTDLQKVLLHCESVQLPGINISSSQSKTFGEVREIPYERTFETISMTFFVDNTMQVKLLFDEWAGNAIQNRTTRKFNYYKQYVTDMFINVYDKNENQRFVVKLYECYPKNVMALSLDHNSREIMKLQVSINYKYWESNTIEAIAVSDVTGSGNYTMPKEVPDTYYTNFNQYQAGYGSFENARTSLYATEDQAVGLGSTYT